MNYDHAYHAGNFADVFKHIILSRMVEYLKKKEKAFRVIDTHSGSGSYDLPNMEAEPTPEWIDGIGRLRDWKPTGKVGELMEPYLSAVFEDGKPEGINGFTYPGSPMIARRLMRKQDRLSAIELHPEAFENLKDLFKGDYQARIMELDGWLVPGSHLPPKEARGLTLIDPPFEQPAEFNRMIDAFEKSAHRFSGGTMACWYPLKHDGDVRLFKTLLKESKISNLMVFELEIAKTTFTPSLYGNGMVIRNAPYKLEAEMIAILKELVPILEREKGSGRFRIERLTDE